MSVLPGGSRSDPMTATRGTSIIAKLPGALDAVGSTLMGFARYFGLGGRPGQGAISRPDELAEYIASHASLVAQTSLYGYLKTRAGQRFPDLFSNDEFLVSINIAKWHVWIASVGDLAVFSGGLLSHRGGGNRDEVAVAMERIIDDILQQTGIPEDSGPEFAGDADRLRSRIADCDWSQVEDGASPFSESPEALVHWAPIIDELKQLDAGIVRNSVRFRWIEVRRNLRRRIDAPAVMKNFIGARSDS